MPPPDPPTAVPARPGRSARKPPRAGLVGPLFKWELVRLARRGQDARARFLLASSLFVVLTLFTVWSFRDVPLADLFTGTSRVLSIQDSAKFANNFALTVVLTQLAVLCLLTPAYSAGGIAEEKEKKTFPFLLVTELTPREIVFGKFLGRLVFLLGVMLAGLPVLALTLLYGGVSFRFLLTGYLLTGTTVTLLAAVGVMSAAYAETFRGALFRSYGLAALHVCAGCGAHPIVSPFGIVVMIYAMDAPDRVWIVGAVYGAIQLMLAAAAVRLAVVAVRRSRAASIPQPVPDRRKRAAKEPELPAKVQAEEPPIVVMPLPEEPGLVRTAERVTAQPVRRAWGDDRPRRRRRDRLHPEIARRPAVGDRDPFWWKEWHVAPAKRDADDESIRGVMIAVGVVVGLTLGLFLLIAAVIVLAGGGERRALNAAQGLLLFGGGAGMFTYLLMVGSAAGASVCRERQRLTLESLLTIPVDRRSILWPKWAVSLSKGWWWGIPATACVGLGLAATDPPILVLPGFPYLVGTVPFAASYGLWLSTRCRTITRATLWFLPAAGGLTLLPMVAVWEMDSRTGWYTVGALGVAAVAVSIGAFAFWRFAWAEFEREGR